MTPIDIRQPLVTPLTQIFQQSLVPFMVKIMTIPLSINGCVTLCVKVPICCFCSGECSKVG